MITNKLIVDLDIYEYRQLWGLGFGDYGDMQEELSLQRYYKGEALAWMVKEDKKICSWALVIPPGEIIAYDSKGDIHEMYVYTRKSERHKGLASKLTCELIREYGKLRVYPHDERSGGFFSNFVPSVEIYDNGVD